jgi:hypothetical protein
MRKFEFYSRILSAHFLQEFLREVTVVVFKVSCDVIRHSLDVLPLNITLHFTVLGVSPFLSTKLNDSRRFSISYFLLMAEELRNRSVANPRKRNILMYLL